MQTEAQRKANLVGKFWTRWEHGNHPVKVWETENGRRYELLSPDGPKEYDSFKAFLLDMYGKNPHMSFNRYFRVSVEQNRAIWSRLEDGELEILPAPPPGIDLEARGHEVRKLLLAKFGGWINSSGYDPEEILQEVNVGILRRNVGRCVFDPKKSSFGHYVFMVCNGVLANYHRRDKRRKTHEQSGLLRFTDEGLTLVDVTDAEIGIEVPYGDLSDEASAVQRLQDWIAERSDESGLAQSAIEVLPLVRQGFKRKEIAEKMDWSIGKTSKVLRHLRQSAEKWYELN